MKVTNVSANTVYLTDINNQFLASGAYVYLPNTSDVIASATSGSIFSLKQAGSITLEDTVTLTATSSVTLTHGFLLAPSVFVLKQVGLTWVDATGTYDVFHDVNFLSVTLTNTTPFTLTYFIRLL